jgi:parvulin-like peptidyl-prolyl isomerase
MVPAFEEACFNNAPGVFFKVQTEFGHHIIQVYIEGGREGGKARREGR